MTLQSRFQKYDNIGEYDTKYIFETLGYNVRMTDFAASMGLIQLGKLEDLNEVRGKTRKSYQILSINILGFYLPIKLQ